MKYYTIILISIKQNNLKKFKFEDNLSIVFFAQPLSRSNVTRHIWGSIAMQP